MSHHRPFEISIRVKPPASLTHTVEQRISHELKTVKRKAKALETPEDLNFMMEKEIDLLHFNFPEPDLNVDFYTAMEAEVTIFRVHQHRDSIGVSVDIPALRGQINEIAPADWPQCIGPDTSLGGCLWAIQTRDVIAPDGLLPLPYAASPSPVLVTLIQTFSTPVYSECIMISRNMSAFHPLTASKSGKVSLSLVSEWTLLNLPTMAARRSTQDHRHQTTGRYRQHFQNETVDRDYNGFHGPPVEDSSGRNFHGPRERLHHSNDYGRDYRDQYQSGSRPGYQPERNNLRRLGPLPRHLRGGAPLDTSGVSSHSQPREARAAPSPPLDRQPPSTRALDLQAVLDEPILLDDLQVREPIVNNNTPGQTPPPPQAENLSMSVSGNTSASDTQGVGSDLDQQHNSSGSNAAPAVAGAEASQLSAPAVAGAEASQLSAPAVAGAEASQLSANLRSQDKRGPDGTPLEGHPAHLTEEDITFMNQMLKEWTDDYPMDVGCTKHFAPLITHDQANKRYQVNAQKVTTFNVNMLRSLKKQNKKEPHMSLLDRTKQAFKSTKPPTT